MKRALIVSLAINCLIIISFAAKRLYYSNSDPKENATQISFYDDWNDMRSSLYNKLSIDSTDIVFVGNSLTDAFPVTELFGSHVKNRGIGGNTTMNVLGRIATIASAHPRKIFIEIGINDLIHYAPVDTVFENYKKIIDSIRIISPKTKIFVQSLLPTCKGYRQLNDAIESLNSKLRSHCEAERITYLNIHTKLLKEQVLDSDYTRDGVHLNGRGYTVWADAIEKYVR